MINGINERQLNVYNRKLYLSARTCNRLIMLLVLTHFAGGNAQKPSGTNKDKMNRTCFHIPVIVKVVFPGIGAPIKG